MFRLLSPFLLFAPAASGIVFVGATSGFRSGTGTFDISLDGTLTGGIATSPANGDLKVVALASTESASVNMTVTDTTNAYARVVDLYANGARDTNLEVWHKIHADDLTVRCNPILTAAAHISIGICFVVRFINETPLDVAITTATATDNANVDGPAITPTTNGSMILSVGANSNTQTATTEPTRTGWTPSVYRNEISATKSLKLAVESRLWATGDGAVDPPAWVDSDSDADCTWAAAAIALRPAA